MAFICKSKFFYYFTNSHFAVQKTAFHHLHFIVEDILLHSFIGLLFEISPKIIWGNAEMLAYRFGFYLFGIANIRLDVLQYVQ